MFKVTPDPPETAQPATPALLIPATSPIDSPEALLNTLAKLSGAQFSTDTFSGNGFPIDAMNISLSRAEMVATLLQSHLSGTDDVLPTATLASVADTLKAQIIGAKIMLNMWHAGVLVAVNVNSAQRYVSASAIEF